MLKHQKIQECGSEPREPLLAGEVTSVMKCGLQQPTLAHACWMNLSRPAHPLPPTEQVSSNLFLMHCFQCNFLVNPRHRVINYLWISIPVQHLISQRRRHFMVIYGAKPIVFTKKNPVLSYVCICIIEDFHDLICFAIIRVNYAVRLGDGWATKWQSTDKAWPSRYVRDRSRSDIITPEQVKFQALLRS